MIYQVVHTTTYEYREPVSLSQHLVRLRPRDFHSQTCTHYDITISPQPKSTVLQTDYFGNPMQFVALEQPHNRLVIESRSTVRNTFRRRFSPEETPSWEYVRDQTRGCQIGPALEASEFLFDSPLIKASDDYREYAASSFTKGRPVLDAVLDLTKRIHEDFTFDSAATTVSTPVDQVLKNKRGVCQDFAHVQIACLRSLGLPARYISGYIETIPPPGQEKLVGADASHAWVSFYCHGLGWIDVDPTNNLLVSLQHVTLAWGRDYSDVTPVRGVILGSGAHTVKVSVDMRPLPPSPEA